MCRMSTQMFFIACLLSVCIRADAKKQEQKSKAPVESACDCSSETARATQFEEQLNALKSNSQKSEAEINSLQSQVKELSEQLENAKKSKEAASASQEGGELSMMGFASKVGSMTHGVVKHALDRTDLDEKLATHVNTHVGAATGAAGKMASSFKESIASVNYTDVMERVSSSKAYQTVAEKTKPHLEKARVTLEPHLTKAKDMAGKAKDMAGPHLAKAQPTLEKAKTKAIETYAAGAAVVHTHVLPVLTTGGSSALDRVSALALAQLERIMTPVFEALHIAVPDHANTLPTHAFDRLLFLLVAVVLAYYSLYFVRVALRLALRLTARTSLMSLKIFQLVVMIPLRILLYLIDFAWWVATLFYCCGLCRSKKNKLAAKAKKERGLNGDSAAKAETVTAAECQALFEMSKEKGKVEEGAKQLAKFVKEKKEMKASSVKGKILTKDVFLATCKKYNVNVKKLDL